MDVSCMLPVGQNSPTAIERGCMYLGGTLILIDDTYSKADR